MFAKSLRLGALSVVCLFALAGCNQKNEADVSTAVQTEFAGLEQQQPALPFPDLKLATLDERPVPLGSYLGQPVVLNLWATWCPPCRREMPVLEQAQADFPGVSFVLINQGESADRALDFLESEGLELSNVLLDPSSEAMRALRTGGLPTTFFFDAEGVLVDIHLGEITQADLANKISTHF